MAQLMEDDPSKALPREEEQLAGWFPAKGEKTQREQD